MTISAETFALVEPALDRFQEAHYWLHKLEDTYHQSKLFRWHFNAFLKSVKEVPDLAAMKLQNRDGFSAWFKTERAALAKDPLIQFLSKQRDLVVHKDMLVPSSTGSIGITEGRDFKIGITFPVHPLEDSDDAMDRYLNHVLANKDFLGLLADDDDSLPCIQRQWRLSNFDQELVELSSQAWLRTGQTVNAVIVWLGEAPLDLSLSCRHSDQRVQFKIFDRNNLNERLKQLRNI
jgi:hypothetical protein